MTTSAAIWDHIASHPAKPIQALVEQDWAARSAALVKTVAGLRFDWSKTHLDQPLLSEFGRLADTMRLDEQRRALFAGEIVNPSEGRAAEHSAQRGVGRAESVDLARQFHMRMRALIDVIDADGFGPVAHIIHIGIGGSALGPDLLVDALGRDAGHVDVAIVSNVDGAALKEAVEGFDPQATLVIVASKTFTTTETMTNARSALQWLEEGGVDDPLGRIIAVTAAPDRALEWGVDETRILPFSESVGGRYSLWSSIGLPAAIALGWDAFAQLLDGAAEMDRHFRDAPWLDNAPVLAAFADLYYAQVRRAETRAVFAYDERLRLLPAYLQQLEMESNGKSVLADGTPLDRPSAPITWGGVGTDAQHAVFQLLHQGTHLIPVEFVAAREPGHQFDFSHHEQLLANCFAQGAALMAGKASDDGARNYPGDRPSSTILLDDVTPYALGALIAFYEHRTFANAVLLGINPFDQFGVELGKAMAKALGDGSGALDPSTAALMDWAGLGDDAGDDAE